MKCGHKWLHSRPRAILHATMLSYAWLDLEHNQKVNSGQKRNGDETKWQTSYGCGLALDQWFSKCPPFGRKYPYQLHPPRTISILSQGNIKASMSLDESSETSQTYMNVVSIPRLSCKSLVACPDTSYCQRRLRKTMQSLHAVPN